MKNESKPSNKRPTKKSTPRPPKERQQAVPVFCPMTFAEQHIPAGNSSLFRFNSKTGHLVFAARTAPFGHHIDDKEMVLRGLMHLRDAVEGLSDNAVDMGQEAGYRQTMFRGSEEYPCRPTT